MDYEICIILVLLHIQVYIVLVTSCPTSKIEWDIAARKKNCSRIASQQNRAPVEKFKFHCVINGYRNETLEVCAPSRVIFGHCVEFNLLGGVIQDQWSSPCKKPFPKYPNCYEMVSKNWNYPTTEKMTTRKTTTTSTSTATTTPEFVLIIRISILILPIVLIPIAVIMVVKERRIIPKSKENVGLTSIDANQDNRDYTIPLDKENIEDRLM